MEMFGTFFTIFFCVAISLFGALLVTIFLMVRKLYKAFAGVHVDCDDDIQEDIDDLRHHLDKVSEDHESILQVHGGFMARLEMIEYTLFHAERNSVESQVEHHPPKRPPGRPPKNPPHQRL